MWFLTAIFQAVGQAVTWILPISENGHSSIFHDFSGRFTGSVSELTGLIHIGIAVGFVLAFYKLFIRLFAEFFGAWGDLFHKRLTVKKAAGARKFMFMSILAFVPMLLLLIPADKYGNVYGLLRFTACNQTLLDDGIFFAVSGALLVFATLRLRQNLNNKNIVWYTALLLGLAAAISLPVAGLSFVGTVFCLSVIMGVAKKPAYRFAVVLSVPVLIGVGIYEICTCVTYVNVFAGILGVVIAAAASYLVLKLFVWVVHNAKLLWFACYDFGLAAICIVVGIFELLLR